MKIIISPAKQMHSRCEFPEPRTIPLFLEQANTLRTFLRSLSYAQLKTLLACNDKIASLNFERYQSMDLRTPLGTTAAILSYDGIQYTYMAPHVFESAYFDWVQTHVRILSGFYGIVRPLDGIVPYRLEMQAKLTTDFCRNLYDFWGDSICRALLDEENAKDSPTLIINLASREYSRVVERYLPSSVRFLTCRFAEQQNGQVLEKGVYVKMARGEMVRFLAESRVQPTSETTMRKTLEGFNRLGFSYAPEFSDAKTLVFLMPPAKTAG